MSSSDDLKPAPSATPPAADPSATVPSKPASTTSSTKGPSWTPDTITTQLAALRKSDDELAAMRKTAPRKVTRFYLAQNAMIDEYLTPVVAEDPAAVAKQERKITLAVRLSLAANMVLFVCQVVAAVSSGSMALFATAADAFMDLLSGGVLLVADHAARRQNVLDYPTGKKRYETIGIIVFSTLMATLSLQILVQAITKLASDDETKPVLELKEIALVCTALVLKFCLFIYCYTLRSNNMAKVLMTDHRNDLGLNSLGLIMSLLGVKVAWWLDPVGGLCIGLLIFRSWASSAWENIQLLVGRSAPASVLNKVTYLAATHDPAVQQVESCRAYFLGNAMFVEVDIVLPPSMTLQDSHNIGESLQKKLEILPNVERAFVHCDFEFTHRPEHSAK
ncbi:cation diffusion facilitator family transporter [Allomyces macrogynus ATCC 38327]|uniref:Cation diffusion facilitator family transporter n=1 Tax=Allomyces macrogynus (strain ATCC 38327) TaxID=578462 RepID=A0A0L0TA35_ALLM3|nr:cation diffusion facilitator family transporter [Allomyces macrogynus ATCC 38327]|eukprot:KNE71602.1 cation diffusion facilitator family transporter [Allomyces macrogynus ATCC 38327]